MDLARIADGWIRHWRAETQLRYVIGFDDIEAVDDLVREDPDRGLDVILKILDGIEPLPTDTLLQVLAAGPLEDLLAHHGPAIIDRVESQARADDRFNLLLGGVWPSSISPDVWARVQRIRKQVW